MTTSIKTCFKCKAEKPTTEFYKHSEMADGYLGKCKECAKRDTRTNRGDRAEYYRAYDRERGSRRTAADTRDYRERNPVKHKAHTAVHWAMRSGRLYKKPCEVCSDREVHAHHDDYSKPLEVRWLCALHHQQWHVANGEGANANVPRDVFQNQQGEPNERRITTSIGGLG